MVKLISVANNSVESALRQYLEKDGYLLSRKRSKGETGVDILATKADEQLYIEVIGYNDSPPTRARDFFEVFFRSVSRLNQGAKRIVIALPERFELGLRKRASVYGPAWERLGKAFPELELWLVDHEQASIRRTRWMDWLEK